MATKNSQHENCAEVAKDPSGTERGNQLTKGDELKTKSADFVDTNGDFNLSACEVLPNNNECENIKLSQCKSDRDCVSSSTITNYVIPAQNLTCQDSGESTLSDAVQFSQESNTCTSGDTESTQESTSSKCDETSSQDAVVSGSEFTSDYSESAKFNSKDGIGNGAIRKPSKKMSKSDAKRYMDEPNVTGRGRPRKELVAMYHSQISGDKNTIKIRIKKSNLSAQIPMNPQKKKSGRRKKHKVRSDTDVSDYESSRKRCKLSVMDNSLVSSTEDHEPVEQSGWGQNVPYEVLFRVFENLCVQEGCLPVLIKLCKVCKLWRDVAMSPALWWKMDLNWVREKFRTDLFLHWLIQNRLRCCRDLNLGEWKVRDIQRTFEALSQHCPELRSLNLSGWKGLNADNFRYISSEFEKLERLDLSSINSTSTLNSQPLVNLAQTMKSRLTHLVLAHNKMAGFTQIMAAIAANCPNLQLLDISNIRTMSSQSVQLQVEKFQIGCPKLRVLRITNSQIVLAPGNLQEQVASPGFPLLEELSVAGLKNDKSTTAIWLDDDGIERLLKNSNRLRLLDVRGCSRLSDSGLVRVPAWDLEHLFLSGCYITRAQTSGLELIVQKWNHSLVEVDLAWSTATAPLDAAVLALAEKAEESRLRTLNLCGSSVSLDPVKAVLLKCPNLHSINLQSCRALPRGIKRLYTGLAVTELRQSFQDKPKTEESDPGSEQTLVEKPLTM